MVAVRSAHLNKAGEFDPKKWIASLGISSQQSCERLAETWDYCREKTQGHPQADLLLWRGVEMVRSSPPKYDIDTLRAALLFPLADGEVVSEEVMQESVGKSVVTPPFTGDAGRYPPAEGYPYRLGLFRAGG